MSLCILIPKTSLDDYTFILINDHTYKSTLSYQKVKIVEHFPKIASYPATHPNKQLTNLDLASWGEVR
jgi:hypothetical protein